MSTPTAHDLDVAVIGMACRFPGAPTPEAFWANLQGGVSSVSFFTDEELQAAGVAPEILSNAAYVRASAVLDGVDLFDASFFSIGAREAQLLDPQQRLFLEAAHEALERAGYDPERHLGPIGVFAGTGATTYLLYLLAQGGVPGAASAFEALISNDKDYLASRVAYKLNLSGPAVVVQTACSTSLVAVHLACQSLLAGECDLALAGGVSIAVPQRVGYLHEEGGILSRDGKCRPFDAEASGTFRGNGLGIVVLKRMGDAMRDRDLVQAVVRGSAINNDGARKVGFTAPAVDGQVAVIRAAHASAGIDAESIGYVEAHGTATALGDPVEIAALTEAFRGRGKAENPCAIGSVKGNFGHLDTAAGVAGFIKAVLMLQHGELVPSLHFERPNPGLHLEDTPFRVSQEHGPWPALSGGPRRAGVSSFGIGGTNAHVVLEEHRPAPDAATEPKAAREHVLVVSARSAAALEKASSALAAHLRQRLDDPLGPVEFTLLAGRRPFPYRKAVVASRADEAARLLEAADASLTTEGASRAATGRPVCLVFPGQGAQYLGMAAGLYQRFAEFRAEFDACADALRAEPIPDLREIVFASAGGDPEGAGRLARTDVTQPALFAVEWALARQLFAFGLRPDALLGHSVGEYVAACVAGVMERDDAVRLVAARGRLMVERCAPGAMLAVGESEERVRTRLLGWFPAAVEPGGTSGPEICVVNAPDSCVVGGTLAEIVEVEGRLDAEGVAHARLATSHAFHSRHMEPALAPFAALVAGIRLSPPRIPFVSNLTGRFITAAEATDPSYWVMQLRGCVRFSEGVALVLQEPDRILLETGPGSALTSLARRLRPRSLSLPCLGGARRAEADDRTFLGAVARLWAAGVPLDWSASLPEESRRRVVLPTYPFERQRFWALGRAASGSVHPAPLRLEAPPSPDHANPGGRLPEAEWLYVPSWRRTEAAAGSAGAETPFCILADRGGLGEALAREIRSRGGRVTLVRRGEAFSRRAPGEIEIHPGHAQDYDALMGALEGDADRCIFFHLWGLDSAGEGVGLEDGLFALSSLGQALARGARTERRVLVVTRGAEDVLGTELMDPLGAALGSLARVVSQEYPNVAIRTVDLAGTMDGLSGPCPAEVVAWLLAEGRDPQGPPAVACRGLYRWIRAFEPLPAIDEESALGPLRRGGVYLVTGGLGTVGLALARFLAEKAQARLVLTSRSGLARGEASLRALGVVKDLAAEVLVRPADAADEGAMRRVIEEARARFGRIDGAIHAAGHLGPGAFRPLSELKTEEFARHLRPKLEGARVLDLVLGDAPVDFVLTTSSLSSDIGGLGLGAYAAANRALDAFVTEQRRRGKSAWRSVLWDGFRLDTAAPRSLAETIGPDEAGRTLGRIFAGSHGRVLVSTTDLALRAARWTERASLAGETAPVREGLVRHDRPALSAAYAAPESEVERKLCALWAEALSLHRVGLDDGFFELGGSSLLAVHLTSRMRRELDADVSVAILFEAPTVRALARVIDEQQGSDQGLKGSAHRGRLRKEAQRGRTVDAAGE